jgi:hypothetical protein
MFAIAPDPLLDDTNRDALCVQHIYCRQNRLELVFRRARAIGLWKKRAAIMADLKN